MDDPLEQFFTDQEAAMQETATATAEAAPDASASMPVSQEGSPAPDGEPTDVLAEAQRVLSQLEQQEAQQAEDAPEGEEPQSTPEMEALRQELDALRAQMSQRDEEEFAKQTKQRQLIEAIQAQRSQKEVQALLQELNEYSPEAAQKVARQMGQTYQQAQQAKGQVVDLQKGMAALAMALQDTLPPEQFQQVVDQAEQLVSLPTVDAMQSYLGNRRNLLQSSTQREQQLEAQLRAVLAQLEVGNRNPRADRVETAPGAPATGQRAADATDYDDYFSRLVGELGWQ